MNLYSLTIHFRAEDGIQGKTTYLAHGRSLAEAKRFARAKFKNLNPRATISRIDNNAADTTLRTAQSAKTLGLRYTR